MPKKEKKGTKGIILSTYVEPLACKLTDTELMMTGGKMAAAEKEARDHEVNAGSVKAALNARSKELDEKLRDLASIYRSRSETRDVAINVEQDPKNRRMAYHVRCDTEEVVSHRALSDSELQQTLPLGDKEQRLKDAATKAVKKKLAAEEIRALAEKEKIDPEALLKAVTDERNKVVPLKDVSKVSGEEASKVAASAAKKLIAAGVRSETGAAKIEEAAKDLGLSVEDLTAAMVTVERSIFTDAGKKDDKK